MKTTIMETLPDYASLCQIRNALWNVGPIRGAVVMVGSGFSKYAKRTADTVPTPPLWGDFVNDMLAELYPNGKKYSTQEPLALAQEYRAALGPAALENLIRSRIRDTEWIPGNLHERLLKLPWTDVLTTNWDTLLERTVEQNPDLSYDVIRTTSDIARTSAPRITKLHGSLPSHGPFIFTEEDFRKYPSEFPAFVNLARQIFLQNELCLVGFSGNDPNFIEWSGWVRDQLGSAVRPIRLVGALSLSFSRRRYFEERNVTAVDLAPLVTDLDDDERHYHATELFLKFLADGRPRPADWKMREFDSPAAKTGITINVSEYLEILRKDRCAYPGWLVMPVSYRLQLRSEFPYNLRKLSNFDIENSLSANVQLAIEIVWRYQKCFASLPDTWEKQILDIVVRNADGPQPIKDRILLRVALIKEARRRHDITDFEERLELLEALNNADATAEAAYERCLMAREFQDYRSIITHIDKIKGDDPVWKMRHAALLSELGDSRKPVQLVYEALRELKQRRSMSPGAIWILSREAWASWLLDGAGYELSKLGVDREEGSVRSHFKEARCDPWDEIHWQDAEIVRASKDRAEASRTRVPSFDPGSYVIPGTKFYGVGATFPDAEIMWLSEVAGIPLRLGHTDLLASRFGEAILCSHQEDRLRLWWLIRCAVNGQLDNIREQFTRSSVARMDDGTVLDLIENMQSAIKFMIAGLDPSDQDTASRMWSNRASIATDLLEIVSFLSSRCDTERALRLIRFGTELAHQQQWVSHNFFRNISTLIARSLYAVEPTRRCEVCLAILKLPLVCEKNPMVKETIDWSAVLDVMDLEDWRRVERTGEWVGVIERLCRAIADKSCETSRGDAIHRVFEVSHAGLLTESEHQEYGRVIWMHVNEDGSPAACEFYPHVLPLLPGAEGHNVDEMFSRTVIGELANGRITEERLASLHSASFDSDKKYVPFALDTEDADKILEGMLQWKARPKSIDPFSRQELEDRNVAVRIGSCLASTVLPCSSVFAKGSEFVDTLLGRIETLDKSYLICAAPVIASKAPEFRNRATRLVQKGLIGRDPDSITMALNAVLWFHEMDSQVPQELVSDTLSICLMRREPGLLGALICVQKFAENGNIQKRDIMRLSDALELLWAETNYRNWSDETRSSDVGLLRKVVVKICKALRTRGVTEEFVSNCIEVAKKDPMPEVRFAE